MANIVKHKTLSARNRFRCGRRSFVRTIGMTNTRSPAGATPIRSARFYCVRRRRMGSGGLRASAGRHSREFRLF